MQDFYLYFLINPINCKIFYVGKGKNLRVFSHESYTRRGIVPNKNKHLYRTILKILNQGLEIIYCIVEDNLLEQEAFDLEKEWIDKLGMENLCNLHPGGRGGSHPATLTPESIEKRASKQRGRKLSEEHKIKISNANRGKLMSEENKIKAKERVTGKNNPMYGKSPSKETREKISKAGMGRIISEETKMKISTQNKGRVRSEECKSRISEAKTGKPMSQEARINMSNSHKGKILSAETREKISEANLGKKFTESHKEKLSDAAKLRTGNKNPRWVNVTDEDILLIKKLYIETNSIYKVCKRLRELGKNYGKRVVERIINKN